MYIHFTDEEKREADTKDLVALLTSMGEEVKSVGSQYEWRGTGHAVSIIDNVWYDQYDQVGGAAISFVKKYFDKTYPEALRFLLGEHAGEIIPSKVDYVKKKTKEFKLPEKNKSFSRVFAYLTNTRGLSRDIVYHFVHRDLIYESFPHHNVVFVGTDKDNKPVHAHSRGTGSQSTYKQNAYGSNLNYSFNWKGTNNRIFLFEAPIDMLSFIQLHPDKWWENSYAAACGVTDIVLKQLMTDNPGINEVYVCFDNDEVGKTSARKIRDKLFTQGIRVQILTPDGKDWNDDLNHPPGESEVIGCPTVS